MGTLWLYPFIWFVLLRVSYGAAPAKKQYYMNMNSDCIWAGRLEVPRDQITYLNGMAPSNTPGGQTTSCRLQFSPQEKGDMLEVTVLSGFFIEECRTTLSVSLSGHQQVDLGCRTPSSNLPRFESRDGIATIVFQRRSITVSNYYFQITIKAFRSEETPGAASGSSSSDVGLIVGIIAGVVAIIVLACIICICCRRRRRERLAEKRQFINGAGLDVTQVSGVENGVYTHNSPYAASPSSNKRLLAKKDSSEEGGDGSVGGRSALDRFGVPPSRRRGQQPGDTYVTESEVGRRRLPQAGRQPDNYEDVESEVGRRRQPPAGRQFDNYEDVESEGRPRNDHPPSPILSALRNNPKFRQSFCDNEADADDRARRVSDGTSSGDSQYSRDIERGPGGRPVPPKLPPVPRSPSRSPSPQRRGEKIAAIYRARPSSSHDAARLDSDRSNDTPPRDEPSPQKRDTRHTLRPHRGGRRRSRDDTDSDSEERQREQRRRDREDEERQRRRRQKEEEEEERRHREAKRKREAEERRQREEEEEREKEERKRREEKKKRDAERKKREEEEEEEEKIRRRRANKESDGSEYEGRFKKSASGRRSKGKGQRMGRSRSTGNALEEMDERYQRSRSKSPGSAHSLNFIEDDETDLDSNYMPFRRAGSKTSLYASRSSLYGRRRKNSMGETVSVSSRTFLDDTDSRLGDFDRSRMSQTELQRVYKSTGELDMRSASAHVVREVGTSTSRGGSVGVYGRKTVAKGRRSKRYSRGTQTPTRGGRRDSVGSTKSGKSGRLKSSRSRESLGGRRSRSRGLTDDDDSDDNRRRRRDKQRSRSRNNIASDDSSDNRSKHSHKSSCHKPKKSVRSGDDLSDSEGDHIADDQSVAPSSIYGVAPPAPYIGGYPQYMPVAGYPPPPLMYQPVVAPGGPPPPPPTVAQPVKPPVAPKPSRGGSRWDDLVNLTEGMKQRRRQMGESVTEDGTESVLSSMWSQPTYKTPQKAAYPPSYTTAQRLPEYPEYSPSESNV